MTDNVTDDHDPKDLTGASNEPDSDSNEQSAIKVPRAPSSPDEYTRHLEGRIRELEHSVHQLVHSLARRKHKLSRRNRYTSSDTESESVREIDNLSFQGTDNERVRRPHTPDVPEPADANKLSTVAEIFRASYLGFWHRLEGDVVYAIELYIHGPDAVDENDDPHINIIRRMTEAKAIDYISAGKESLAHSDTNSIRCIRINSMMILKAFREIDSSIPLDGCPLVFYSPFSALVESYEPMKLLLQDAQKKAGAIGSDDQQEVVNHLSCYMRLLETDILPIHLRLKDSNPNAEVCFWELSYLFGDEEDLYHPGTTDTLAERSSGHQQIWRLLPRNGFAWLAPHQETQGSAVELACYHLDFDGHLYVPVCKKIEINFFSGRRLITSLPIYPLRFASNASQILQESRESGLKFIEAVKETQMSYRGWTLRPRGEKKDDRGFVSSNVIIDCAEAFKAQPDLRPKATDMPEFSKQKWRKRVDALFIWRRNPSSGRPRDMKKTEWSSPPWSPFNESEIYLQKHAFALEYQQQARGEFSEEAQGQQVPDENLILLPRWLVAYSLQDRIFVMVETLHLKRLEDTGDPFRDLAITPGHKKVIWSIVHSHFEKRKMEQTHSFYDISQDIIHNKGRGLVVLLHGVPGVGKTSTAEAVAQKWKKPLLAITCGDLGLEAAEVERSLKEIFRLAQLWDCVLLLDEADVFISQRQPSDLQRNSLVSVFLRVLEYYSGILFLTTNRVGNMDEAFKSRIHMSLYYPPLRLEQTKKIWTMNLARLEAIEKERHRATGQPKLTIATADIMKFAMEHFAETNEMGKAWNGRQIRNAFLTAAALARYDQHSAKGKPHDGSTHDITVKHFKIVSKASWGFDEYLHETKGKSDAQLARYMGTRSDHITSSTPIQSPPAVSDRDSPYPPRPHGYQSPSNYESAYAEQQYEANARDPAVSPGRSPYTPFDPAPMTEPQYNTHNQARQTSMLDPYGTHGSSRYGRQSTSRPWTPQPPPGTRADQRTESLLSAPRDVASGHLQTEDPSYYDDEEYL